MARDLKRGNMEKGTAQTQKGKSKRPRISVKQSVTIIGAGRLGTALAIALSAAGYAVETVVSRRVHGAHRTARVTGASTLALSINQLSALPPSKILLITTPDDAIESVASQVAGSIKWNGRGGVALHASGAISSDSLKSLSEIGFSTGSMHPLIAVSDPRTGAMNLKNAHFCVEGQPQAVRIATSIVRKLGGKSFSIATRDKALYHAAAVMSSGHLVALFDIAIEMLIKCGLTERQASDGLLPLLSSTVENLTHNTPSRSLTGTFARADAATVVKHIDALHAKGGPDAKAAYKILGIRSLELARKNGADTTSLKKIKLILDWLDKR